MEGVAETGRQKPAHNWNRRLFWLAVAVAFVGLVVWRVWYPGRTFDPVVWHDESLDGYERAYMADRMIARDAMVGMTREEVLSMLGEPTIDSRESTDASVVKPYWLGFRLGPCRGLTLGFGEFLRVEVGRDGRVSRCWIWTD